MFSFIVFLSTVLLLICARLISNYRNLSIPGPFLASISDLWRAFYQYHGTLRAQIEALHDTYSGPMVRYGVVSVSISEPAVVPQIYNNFSTSESYDVIIGISNGKEVPSLVSTRDEHKHRALRSSVSSAFTPANVPDYEKSADDSLQELMRVLEERQTVDFAHIMLLYSMDAASRMLFSESLGFLKTGQDVGGNIQLIRDRFNHWGKWSSLPGLERLIFRNPVSLRTKRNPSSMAALAANKLKTRMSTAEKLDERDILQKFIDASLERPDILDPTSIIGLLMSSISGAGDTTATTVAATLYFLLQNPAAKTKLVAELGGTSMDKIPAYSSTSNLPYLNAVIKESMRLFPTATFPIERRVPAGGMTLAGTFLPGGTTVGRLPSVLHKDRSVYGEDVQTFRPDRWLGNNEEQLRLMERTHLGFGKGKRVCLGQHIAIMQMKKLVPMLLMNFEASTH